MKTIPAIDLTRKAFPFAINSVSSTMLIPASAAVSWEDVSALRTGSVFFGAQLKEADCRALRVAWKALAGDREGSIAEERAQNGCASEPDRPTEGRAVMQAQPESAAKHLRRTLEEMIERYRDTAAAADLRDEPVVAQLERKALQDLLGLRSLLMSAELEVVADRHSFVQRHQHLLKDFLDAQLKAADIENGKAIFDSQMLAGWVRRARASIREALS